jgi:hypothetical protein
MAQVTIYLPPSVEKKARAGARRAKKSLSAYIASRLDDEQTESGWPKGYVAMVQSWRDDPLDLENPKDEPVDVAEFAKAFP